MDLRQLRYFVALAEELHFGHAAERVHIAQPALSMQIKALEETLGGELFKRTKRSVVLTEAGRLLLVEAKATLAQAAHSMDVVKRALRGDLGCVRIAYSGNAIYSGVLGRALQVFKQAKPGVDVKLLELDPRSQLDALQKGSIDVCLMTTLAVDLPEDVQVTRLTAWPLLIALPKAHALAQQEMIPMSALKRESFVVYAGYEGDDGTSVIRSLTGFSPNVTYKATNAMMVVALVGAGLGLALVPASLERFAAHAGAVLKPFADLEVEMDVSMVRRDPESEPSINAFLACVEAEFSRLSA